MDEVLRNAARHAHDRLSLALLASQPSDRTIGLSKAEVREYSLARAVTGFDADLEYAASRAMRKSLSPDVETLIPDAYRIVPPEVLARTLGTIPGASGGYLVGNEHGGFIDALRNRSVAFRLGAQSLPNLRSTVTIGRQTGTVTVHWQGFDGTSVSAADQSLGQLSLSPKTAIAITDVSEQFLQQGGETAEAFVFNDLARAVAAAVDGAAINGAGGAQPLGIVNTPDVVTNQDAGTASDSKLDAFVQAIGGANALTERAGWVAKTAGGLLLSRRHQVADTHSPLWTGSVIDGRLRGFPATSSEHVGSGGLIFGSWDELVIADWGVLAVATDRSGDRFNAATVGVRALWIVDVALRYPQAFIASSTLS